MSSSALFTLSTLRSHAILAPPSVEDGWELISAPETSLVGHKKRRLIIRDKDLIVAIGREVRITTLSGESWDTQRGPGGSYKTLKSAHLTFEVHHLVLNPTGRLLAVVGARQLIVLVLPKSSYVGSSGEVACRSFVIDDFTFSRSSSSVITDVKWNPLGEEGNSLWVLTSDGKLREYDVAQPTDPTQTLAFLPATSSSKFSAVDPLARYATSFAFGPDSASSPWLGLMVHVLLANGDIYVMAPVMPLRSEVPVQWLQRLKGSVDERMRRVREGEDEDAYGDKEQGLQQEERLSMQVAWVEALVRQTATIRSEESTPSEGGASREKESGRASGAKSMIKLHPPNLSPSGGPAPGVHRSVLRQGPVAFEPSPPEGDEEDAAVDLCVMAVRGGEDGEQSAEPVEVAAMMGVAWSSGRYDVGLLVDISEPRWISSRDPSPAVPTIPIIESIQLGGTTSSDDVLSTNAPSISCDPVQSNVVYVQHSSGVDAISLEPWLSALQRREDALPPSEIARLVKSGPDNPIEGVAAFCNATLGYGLLALASSNQLATVELDLKIGDDAPSFQKALDAESAADQADSASLLLAQPGNFDKIIATVRRPTPDSRSELRKLPSAGKPIGDITADHLLVIGQLIAHLQTRIQAIRAASQLVERRLDLQVRESQRQLKLLKECSVAVASKTLVGSANARGTANGEEVGAGALVEKADRLLRRQDELGERLDGVVRRMMEVYRPQVGDVERRWFDELERLRGKVHGGGGSFGLGRTRGMRVRVQALEEQLEAVKPALRAQAEQASAAGSPGTYGRRQLRPLETALAVRSEEIRKMLRKLEGLSVRVENAGEAGLEGEE